MVRRAPPAALLALVVLPARPTPPSPRRKPSGVPWRSTRVPVPDLQGTRRRHLPDDAQLVRGRRLEPLDAKDLEDPSYEWPDEIDTAIAEAKSTGIEVALTDHRHAVLVEAGPPTSATSPAPPPSATRPCTSGHLGRPVKGGAPSTRHARRRLRQLKAARKPTRSSAATPTPRLKLSCQRQGTADGLLRPRPVRPQGADQGVARKAREAAGDPSSSSARSSCNLERRFRLPSPRPAGSRPP